MSTHLNAHLSPAQAAQVADVSRWTIMRGIKSGKLQAFRDNKNQWRIKSDDLSNWLSAQRAHTVQEEANAHIPHTNAHQDSISQDTLELMRMKAELEAEKALRATIETDRDHWREIARKLVEKPGIRWPWHKRT